MATFPSTLSLGGYPRPLRQIKPDFCYHITSRCNNREFKLSRRECREVFLYALKKALDKFDFKLYALCIMSNHVHYLIEPSQPEDLPKIMHWLNWYTAMCFNRMLKRTGHFWEKRYHCSGFEKTDYQRAFWYRNRGNADGLVEGAFVHKCFVKAGLERLYVTVDKSLHP